jgi:hypothetical protein
MARRRRRRRSLRGLGASRRCAGLKRNGRLRKGYKWKRGGSCPVKVR